VWYECACGLYGVCMAVCDCVVWEHDSVFNICEYGFVM
jgi:hypothetical protein